VYWHGRENGALEQVVLCTVGLGSVYWASAAHDVVKNGGEPEHPRDTATNELLLLTNCEIMLRKSCSRFASRAWARELLTANITTDDKTPIRAMTTNSSTRVNPARARMAIE